ncbi:MAG: hypothetical protein QF441_06175 [Bacteriovoracaceae bacterium]|jgi:hypothetical protein|nr:hypothetical protein [Halobacteriovoraceae bacterium]MDP7320176.1 hypothetical protein [Bacteriovoracaceae bacterium]
MSTESKIKIINAETKEVLFEFPLEDSDQAYAQASQMEKMGLDIAVHNPSVTETLCDTLGIEHEKRLEYEDSVVAEIDDHEGSCCIQTPESKTNKYQ